MRALSAVAGHVWTVWPHLRDATLRPRPPMLGRPWQSKVDDPGLGSIRLTGIFHPVVGARVIVLIVHGIGGSANSPYCLRTAATAHSLGMSSLRLNQRGADRRGEDLYHAGLWTDLRAA